MPEIFDAIIIGGGTAGGCAATFLMNNLWKTLLIDPDPARGKHTSRVSALTLNKPPFIVTCEDENTFHAKTILIATGAGEKANLLEGESRLREKGVWYDTTIEGHHVAQKRAAVIGKTVEAAEEAARLLRLASHLIFVVPSSKLDLPEELHQKLNRSGRVEFLFSTSVKSINGSDRVESITILRQGEEQQLQVDGVFSYLSERRMNHDFLEGAVETAKSGAILIDDHFNTSTKGVFACGDALCAKLQFPEVATAQGLLAALSISQHLETV